MAWGERIRRLICCTTCTTVDERAVKKRNQLRRAVGKGPVQQVGPNILDVKLVQRPPSPVAGPSRQSPISRSPAESPGPRRSPGEDMVSGEEPAMEGKWAIPRAESAASRHSHEEIVEVNEQSRPASRPASSSSTKSYKKARSRFVLDFIYKRIYLGAFEKLKREQTRDATVDISSSSIGSNISEAATNLVRKSMDKIIFDEQESRKSRTEVELIDLEDPNQAEEDNTDDERKKYTNNAKDIDDVEDAAVREQ